MTATDLLKTVDTVLVVDWPTTDVPESLVGAEFLVVVKGGPGPEDYFLYEISGGGVMQRRIGHPPERADLIYSYRPTGELPGIITLAKSLGAKAIWTQSGLSGTGVKDPKGCWLPDAERESARALVEASGLMYFAEPYIGDAARVTAATRARSSI